MSVSSLCEVLIFMLLSLPIHSFSYTYPELKGTTQININPNLTSVAVAIFCFIARVCLFRNIIDQCLLENKYKLIVVFSLSSGKCWVDFDGTMCHAIRYWRCTFNYNRHTWNREMATILHMIQHATKQNVVQGYWWLCVYIRFGKF